MYNRFNFFVENATRVVAKLTTLSTLININGPPPPPAASTLHCHCHSHWITFSIVLHHSHCQEGTRSNNMPMSDVAAALIYTDHGNGATTKHSKALPSTATTTTTSTPTGATAASAGLTSSNMTNSSKADVIAGSAAAAASQLGSMLAPTSNLSLAAMQGQKWQQVFDLDKMIKQLRSAEKTQLRGGGGPGRNGPAAVGGNAGGAGANDTKQGVQVQRLNAADMAYYDMVPKQATRDIVVCNSCNGSYTKAGFNNHIALQHPTIWDAIPNKVSSGDAAHQSRSIAATASGVSADNSQDGIRDPSELLGSPTDTSATTSSCSNGSSSSVVTVTTNNNNNNNNAHASSSSTSSSSTSSRHKSSSSKSSSSSKTSTSTGSGSSTSRSRSKSSKNRHHSELHHKVAGGSKKSSAIAAAAAAAAAAAPPVVKDEPQVQAAPPPITVFSSSSNSSCSMPPTPTLSMPVAGSSNGNDHSSVNYLPAATAQLSSLLDEPQPNKKKVVYTLRYKQNILFLILFLSRKQKHSNIPNGFQVGRPKTIFRNE